MPFTRSKRQSLLLLGVSVAALLAGTNPAFAACDNNAPTSGLIVTCTGTDTTGVVAPASTGVTVNVNAGASVSNAGTAILLGNASISVGSGASVSATTGIDLGAGTSTVNLTGSVTGLGGTAIHDSGTLNLILNAGSSVTGSVTAGLGGSDVFTLGGSTNGSFDAGLLDFQYQNFNSFTKTGTSGWTLTGFGNLQDWTISGGTLTGTTDSITGAVVDNGTLEFNQAAGGVYSGQISGTGSLLKTGTGRVALSNILNSYSGATTINSGTLAIDDVGELGTSGAVSLDNGALEIDSSLTLSQVMSLGAAGGTFNVAAGQSAQLTGIMGGGGTLAKTGAGTLDLRNLLTSSATGTVALNGGTIEINSAAQLGSGGLLVFNGGTLQTTSGVTLAQTVNVTGGGTIDVSVGQVTSLTGVVSGPGSLTKAGLGTLDLSGVAANTVGGSVNLNNGTIRIDSGNDLGTGTLVFNGGTLDTTTGVLMTQTVNVNPGGGTINVNAAATTQLNGPIAGIGGLVKTGFGTLVINGANFSTGDLTVLGGTLSVSNGSALGSGTVVLNGGGLRFTGNAVSGNDVVLAGAGETVDVSNGADTATLNGVVTGTGTLNKTGAGTLALTNSGNAYTGGITISNGILQGDTGSLKGNILDNAGLVFNQNFDGTYTGAISGFGALSKTGTGVLTLSGANTYLGGTVVQNGTLQGDASSLQGSIINNANVTFDQSAVGTYSGTMSGTGSLTKTNTGVLILTGPNTYTGGTTVSAGVLKGDVTSLQGDIIDNATVEFSQGVLGTYSGNLSGAGSLVKSGAGTLILTGANTYSGGTTVSAGTLKGDTTSLQGNIVDNSLLEFNQGVGGTFSGAISGAGSLLKSGAGNLTLSGANTYSGGTTVSAGTLTGNTNSLQGAIVNDAAVVFSQAGVGTYSGAMSGSGSLTKSGAGNLTLTGANSYSGGTTVSNGTLTGDTTSLQGDITDDAALVFNQGGAGTFSGIISGSGSVTKTGAGNLTLSGANTYGGGTTVSAGTLTGDTASLEGAITDNAVLVFNQGAGGTFSSIISGSGSVTKSGAGDLTLSGANTYGGGTTVSAGTLTGDTTSLQGAITDNAALVFNQGAGGTFSSIISGSGSVTKSGAGNLTLSGANTYSGGTTVGAGTLTGDTTSLQGAITDNAALVFNQGSTGTFSSIISGSGSVTKSGAGNLTLSGANTYNGGTTVSAGILTGDTTSLQGVITDDAALVFNQGSSGTFFSAISGSGSVTKSGAGNLTVAGANTYSGGTTVSAGTLTGDTTSLQGAIVNNAEVDFNQAGGATYAGAMSGTGRLVKLGAGNLTLSGANTYGGGTIVSAGALIGNAASLQGDILDNAAVDFNEVIGGIYSGKLSGAGSLVKLGTGNLTLTGVNSWSGGTTVSAGTLRGNSDSLHGDIINNAALIFDQTADGTYNGDIFGNGTFTKLGTGKLVLAGASTYIGGTTVAQGKLAVDGSIIGAVAVNVGATLMGSGTISGDVNESGTLAPGNSIGALAVNGNVTFNPGSIYEVEANAAGQNDLLQINGSVNLNGGTVNVLAAPGAYGASTAYTILNAGTVINGTFSAVNVNLAFLSPLLTYLPNQVEMTLVQNFNPFTSGAHDPVQAGVAQAIQDLGAGNGVYDAVLPLTVDQTGPAFDNLSGESLPGAAKFLRDDARSLRNLLGDHMHDAPGAGTGASGGNRLQDDISAFWGTVTGVVGHTGAQGTAPAQNQRGGGLLFGADAHLAHDRTGGFFFGWDRGIVDTDSENATSTLNTFKAGVYGKMPTASGWDISGGAGLGYSDIDSSRHLTAPVSNPQGNTWGSMATGFIEAGKPMPFGAATIEPFAGLDLTWSHTQGYAETGGGPADLVVGGANTVNPGHTLGARVSQRWDVANGAKFSLSGSLGWHYNYGNVDNRSTMRFTGGATSFDVFAPPIARSSTLAGVSFDAALNPGADITASYDGDLAAHAQEHTFRLGLKVKF